MTNLHTGGSSFEIDGRTFTLNLKVDNDASHPWEDHDGHGPVRYLRDVSGSKRSGEVILKKDGRDSGWAYDLQYATELARRDGWGSPHETPDMTPAQKAAAAVQADIEYLRGYLVGDWYYVGIVVECEGEQESLWGLESNAAKAISDAALELAKQIAATLNERDEAVKQLVRKNEAAHKCVTILRELVEISKSDDWNDSGRVIDAMDDARSALEAYGDD